MDVVDGEVGNGEAGGDGGEGKGGEKGLLKRKGGGGYVWLVGGTAALEIRGLILSWQVVMFFFIPQLVANWQNGDKNLQS